MLVTIVSKSYLSPPGCPNKTLALRLLLRLGYIFNSSHDLLLVAEMQRRERIDISWELMPLLDGSEKLRAFVAPSSSGNVEPYAYYDDVIQGHVEFASPSNDDSTHEEDNAACDDKYYYMFSANRGMFKGEMFGDDWNWNRSTGTDKVKDVYK